jgi:hypothetical protein
MSTAGHNVVCNKAVTMSVVGDIIGAAQLNPWAINVKKMIQIPKNMVMIRPLLRLDDAALFMDEKYTTAN